MHKDYKNICTACQPIIRKVGQFVMSELGKVNDSHIETKDRNSLVSYVDKAAEEMLVEALSIILPEAGFITEENTVTQNKDRDIVWIVDPLDGTNNFLHNIPHFALSIGLLVDGELKVGLVLEPNLNELFYAYENGGAYLNGKKISVSSTSYLSQSIVGTGFPYVIDDVAPLIRTLGHFMRYARGVRRFGAAALDLVYVACGRLDCYYETTLSAWDVAGGALIVKEAGGQVTDFMGGKNYIFGEQLAASNGLIHHELLNAIVKNFRIS